MKWKRERAGVYLLAGTDFGVWRYCECGRNCQMAWAAFVETEYGDRMSVPNSFASSVYEAKTNAMVAWRKATA